MRLFLSRLRKIRAARPGLRIGLLFSCALLASCFVCRPTVDRGLIVAFSVAMPKLPEVLPVSPMSACPRCSAQPGLNCVQLADKVEAIHIERIEAAAKKTRERGPS